MKIRELTNEELLRVQIEATEFLWGLLRVNDGQLVEWLYSKLTTQEMVDCLSDDEEYVIEVLSFDPYDRSDQ